MFTPALTPYLSPDPPGFAATCKYRHRSIGLTTRYKHEWRTYFNEWQILFTIQVRCSKRLPEVRQTSLYRDAQARGLTNTSVMYLRTWALCGSIKVLVVATQSLRWEEWQNILVSIEINICTQHCARSIESCDGSTPGFSGHSVVSPLPTYSTPSLDVTYECADEMLSSAADISPENREHLCRTRPNPIRLTYAPDTLNRSGLLQTSKLERSNKRSNQHVQRHKVCQTSAIRLSSLTLLLTITLCHGVLEGVSVALDNALVSCMPYQRRSGLLMTSSVNGLVA